MDYQKYYGKTSMTMNLHCLLHLIECVEDLGPLWAYSMFSFESFNGTLKKYGYSTNVINQIVEKIVINSKQNENMLSSSEYFANPVTIPMSTDETNCIKTYGDITSIKFYATFHKGFIVFTSTSYTRAKKTADFFVSTRSDRIGKIKYFFQIEISKYAVIDQYVIEKSVDQFLYVQPMSR